MLPERRRGGFVLITAVLVLALLALATPALVFTAAQSELLAAIRLDALRARLAARSAAEQALATWRTSDLRDVPEGVEVRLLEGELGAGVGLMATVERLSPGLWLVRGRGWVGAAAAPRARAGVGLRVATPEAAAPSPGLSEAVDPLRLEGWPEPDLLARVAQARLTGDVSPAPALEAGACDRSPPTNWGAPGAWDHPCRDHFPLLYVPGSLTVVTGSGQGILVVEDDLVLGPDVRFHGIVLVGGRLTAEAGAVIRGSLRVPPGGASAPDVVIADPLAITAALAAAPGLNGPFFPPGRRWIPLF